jgi:hypothetical protein
MERDFIEATDSGKNFRSGQTRFPADRPRSTQARGMSVRFANRLFQGHPPERIQANTGHLTETARNRRNDTLANPACWVRATTSRWTQPMVSERTPHEECETAVRSRERNRVNRCDSEVADDGNIEGVDGKATSLRGIIAR